MRSGWPLGTDNRYTAARRERAQTRRQVRELSAKGRLSAYVLIGLPFAVAAYFLLVRAEYMRPLYTTGYGILMLAGSAV